MNLPNKLTMMRVVLVPVFMIFAALSHYGTADFNAAFMLTAGIIFAVASFTDFLDGYLAARITLSPISASLWTPCRQVPDHCRFHLYGYGWRLFAHRAGGHPVP